MKCRLFVVKLLVVILSILPLINSIYFFRKLSSMDDSTDIPAKRRKLEENSEHNGDSVAVTESDGKITNPKSSVNLYIKPQALARLRQIAKNSNIGGGSPQKQTAQQKDEIEEPSSHDTNQNKKMGESTTDAKNSNDVIISSAGSSPAHSPKPEDLVVLSTPPKKPLHNENHPGTKTVLRNLFILPDQSEEHGEPNKKDDIKTANTIVMNNGEQAATANGIDNPKTSSAPVTPFNFDAAQLKKVLKAMIDEKFKQVEDIYMSQGTESELKERIARLEDENKSLQEYASKLEKAVKLLLDNQKNKKDKYTKSVQTDDIGLARQRPAGSTAPLTPVLQVSTTPKTILQAMSPTLTPTSPLPQQLQQINQVNKQGTLVTSRLTATQASIPGHSVTPASLPQRASFTHQQMVVSSPQGQRKVQYPISPPTRPAPVTVTVHPQTTTTTMISSPSYPAAQVQKGTFVTNSVARQPVPLQQPLLQQRMQTSQPMIVYHRPPAPQHGSVQPVQQFPNGVAVQRPAQQAPPPISVNNQTRTLQNPTRPQLPPNLAVSPREPVNNFPAKDIPGRPVVSIAVVSNGIVLSWNMANQAQSSTRIARYQLFALQDVGTNTAQWKKIGVVNALPLPMACTLTQFLPGNKYHFTVRAQDDNGRCGPLSEPCTVTLT